MECHAGRVAYQLHNGIVATGGDTWIRWDLASDRRGYWNAIRNLMDKEERSLLEGLGSVLAGSVKIKADFPLLRIALQAARDADVHCSCNGWGHLPMPWESMYIEFPIEGTDTTAQRLGMLFVEGEADVIGFHFVHHQVPKAWRRALGIQERWITSVQGALYRHGEGYSYADIGNQTKMVSMDGKIRYSFMDQTDTWDKWTLEAGEVLNALIYFINEVKGYKFVDVAPANRVPKWQRTYPRLEHKEISLDELSGTRAISPPLKTQLRQSPRLHLRRGHWRILPWKSDRTWVSPCLVGHAEKGMIVKDYTA